MSLYVGMRVRSGIMVTKDGHILRPGKSLAVRNHSPNGFEWGYGGSGPAQLALGLLLEETDPMTAQLLYQQFKTEVVSGWKEPNWFITSDSIGKWINGKQEGLPPSEIKPYETIVEITEDDQVEEEADG